MPVFRPGKPVLLGRLTVDTNQLLGDLDIPFDALTIDGDITPDAGGGRATIGVAGLYLVVLSAVQSAGPSGTFGVMILVNGALVAGSLPVSTGARPQWRSTSHLAMLEVGDVVAWQKRSTANITLASAGTNVGLTRVGPVRWT